MKRSNYTIFLDVQNSQDSCLLDMNRGDTHRRLYIHLTDGGAPYPVLPDVFAVLTAKRADGTVLYHPCTVADGQLIYDPTPQTTALVGEMDCQVKLYHSDGLVPLLPDGTVDPTAETIHLLTSARFGIRVNPAVYNAEEDLAPQSEFSALEAAVAGANSVVQAYAAGELTGAQGPQGEKGEKGDPGPQGPQGEKGDPGSTNMRIVTKPEKNGMQVQPTAEEIYHHVSGGGTVALYDPNDNSYMNAIAVMPNVTVFALLNGDDQHLGIFEISGATYWEYGVDLARGYSGGDLDLEGNDLVNANIIHATHIYTDTVSVGSDDAGVSLIDNGNAVLEFYGHYGDEYTTLRHLAPGTQENDAVTKGQLDEAIGDIESALDAVLAIQNTLIGGEEA